MVAGGSGRKRVVTSKPTRNGCRTCRVRKVKCDEGKPSCRRCKSTGRDCEGYSPGLQPTTTKQRALLPSAAPAQTRVWISINAPSSSWRLADFERQSYDYFRFELAPSLAVMLPGPAPSWIQAALQLSLQEEAVFSAVAAMGSVNKAIGILVHPSFGRPLYRGRLEQAVLQYCRSAAALRKKIERAIQCPNTAELAPILLCCILCMCFEVFRGKQTMALSHSALGRRICEERVNTDQKLDEVSQGIYSQISLYNDHPVALGQQEYHDDSCCLGLQLPRFVEFSTLSEAARYLGTMVRMGDHLRTELLSAARRKLSKLDLAGLSEGMHYCLAASFSRTVETMNIEMFDARRQDLLQSLRHWQSSFAALPPPASDLESGHFMAAKILALCLELTLSTCRETSENVFDAFEHDFEHIFGLLDHLLASPGDPIPESAQKQDRLAGREQNRSFSMFSGIVSSLYYFALKCRKPDLRRRAVQILFSAQRREGLEHSSALGLFARMAMQIEEERSREICGPLQDSQEIPEQARFCDIVMAGEGDLSHVTLICCRYLRDKPGHIEMLEYDGGVMSPQLRSSRTICLPT